MSKYLYLYYDGSKSIQEKNKTHILQAINKYDCPLYEKLRNKLEKSLSDLEKSNEIIAEQRAYERSLWWQ